VSVLQLVGDEVQGGPHDEERLGWRDVQMGRLGGGTMNTEASSFENAVWAGAFTSSITANSTSQSATVIADQVVQGLREIENYSPPTPV